MKKTIFWLLLVTLHFHAFTQNLLPEKFRFRTGDDPEWASGSYDDSEWELITPGVVWEKQGYARYDGYAWYRVTVQVPSGLKKTARKYGGLSLHLGKIDDVDYTYFNGKLIGQTGQIEPEYVTAYNIDRVYTIPYKWIQWDQPNTLAVRVFDLWGEGGIYGFPIYLSIQGLSGEVSMVPVFSEPDQVLEGSQEVALSLNLVNDSRKTLSGELKLEVFSDFGKEMACLDDNLELPAEAEYPITFSVPELQPGFYHVVTTFSGKLAYKIQGYNFGYMPEKIDSPPDPQPDLARFWEVTREELSEVDPCFKIVRADSLCTPKRNVYLVKMYSLGNVLIRGWYSVPSTPGRYPAIMLVPGYSSTIFADQVNYGDDIIGFGLNIRGHGNSRDDIDPGFPGFLFYGIQSKETYVYRGAYMDCIRGIDFLFSRPEVDTTRVAVEGSSQGGALTFATAALDNSRIKVCAPQVPFLSDFKDYFKVAVWPGNEFEDFVEREKKMSWDELYTLLSYFDIKNLAGWIRAPMLMGVGLVDEICPLHINFAAYNQVRSEKHYIVYPHSGHGLPQDFNLRKMVFIREKFGLD